MTAKQPPSSRTTLLVVLDSNRMMAGPSRYDTPQYKRATLAAFDAFEHADKRQQLEAAAEVRRKARNAL